MLPDPFPDADFPAAPYPGAVPEHSFVHVPGGGHAVTGDPAELLAQLGATPMAGRVPILTYGSNRNPAKIGWLRSELGLTGAVVVLRCTTREVAAVWAAGLRVVDDQRPAVLAAAPGVVEEHSVWFATPEQVAVLDRCEGRSVGRYRLARLPGVEVRLSADVLLDSPFAYLGAAAVRRPLLVDGAPVRCSEVPQDAARGLSGVPADSDGLAATTVDGPPNPDSWPARLFVYGTLQPDGRAWHLLAPLVEQVRPTVGRGRLFDTGLGFPALLPGDGNVPGHVVTLRDPAAAFAELDRYEGPEYARRRVLVEGRAYWTYVWIQRTKGFRSIARW
ncbi:gamma-glutamylcyclotransferase family protein [Pseudonocardia pini]|uniref:gamma-glutamylcyclotransferase family protein n=1 Tax=Pseudonocardia pini TaxID=2758030 RepID=UPI0015F11F98|nr:gamma-glutamylcyclotransferase family protein [Pseudonocardia pini]